MEGQLSMLSKLVPGSWFKHQSLFQVININISSQIGVYIVLPYMGGGTGVGGGGHVPPTKFYGATHNLHQQEHYSSVHDRSIKRQCGLVG